MSMLLDYINTHYVNKQKTYLLERTPIIVKVGLTNQEEFLEGLHKPFEEGLHTSMSLAMHNTCKQLGCNIFAYATATEISFLLIDYDTLAEKPFNYNREDILSYFISAVTLNFYQAFEVYIGNFASRNVHYKNFDKEMVKQGDITKSQLLKFEKDKKYLGLLGDKSNRFINFTGTVFNLPKDIVFDYFSNKQAVFADDMLTAVAKKFYPAKVVKGANTEEKEDMIREKGKDLLKDYPTHAMQGSFCAENPTVQFNTIKDALYHIEILLNE